MFALTPAELSWEGHEVISCDPLYSLTADEIRARIDATYDALVANAQAARHEFVWHDIAPPEHLGEVLMAVMQRLLMDFPKSRGTLLCSVAPPPRFSRG